MYVKKLAELFKDGWDGSFEDLYKAKQLAEQSTERTEPKVHTIALEKLPDYRYNFDKPYIKFKDGEEMPKDVIIFTDGSSLSNPGKSGAGFAICPETGGDHDSFSKEDVIAYGFASSPNSTNSKGELLAVIDGISILPDGCNIRIVSDSKYVTDAFNARWIDGWVKNNWKRSGGKKVLNVEMWQELHRLVSKHNKVEFEWTKGHAGTELNDFVDSLAVKGSNLA